MVLAEISFEKILYFIIPMLFFDFLTLKSGDKNNLLTPCFFLKYISLKL